MRRWKCVNQGSSEPVYTAPKFSHFRQPSRLDQIIFHILFSDSDSTEKTLFTSCSFGKASWREWRKKATISDVILRALNTIRANTWRIFPFEWHSHSNWFWDMPVVYYLIDHRCIGVAFHGVIVTAVKVCLQLSRDAIVNMTLNLSWICKVIAETTMIRWMTLPTLKVWNQHRQSTQHVY